MICAHYRLPQSSVHPSILLLIINHGSSTSWRGTQGLHVVDLEKSLTLYISQDLVARDLPLRTQLLAEAKKLPELILTEVITSSLPLVAPFLGVPISSGGKTFLGFDMIFCKRG